MDEQDTFINGYPASRQKRHPQQQLSSFINVGEEDQMALVGYKTNRRKLILSWILQISTVGFLRLFFDWYPIWMVRFTCDTCQLDHADYVLLKDQYDIITVEKIHRLQQTQTQSVSQSQLYEAARSLELDSSCRELSQDEGYRYFINKKIKYIWNRDLHSFEKLKHPHHGKSCSYFHEAQGLSQAEQSRRQVLYDPNSIRVHVTSILKLLYTQGLNPFYIFQLFSCALWYSDQYYYFASCIIFISCISLVVQIRETRQTERVLKTTIGSTGSCMVYRNDTKEFEEVNSECLVPGDIIEIPRSGCILQCDAVLVCGNCIVNESMLTGESVPVTKTPVPHPKLMGDSNDILFNPREHSRHMLFCGTRVIQTRFYENQKVTAVVIHTGFMTAKGELVRSILFPKPVNFKFTQDSYKFIGCLALIALIGMIYTLALMIAHGESAQRVIVRTLDLVTIVIPPALPAAMTVGIVFAQKRLRRQFIYCISPNSINLCGAINAFCFDKTGTLTEDGLDLWGVIPVENQRFSKEEKDVSQLSKYNPLIAAMATCHSLTKIDDEIIGDPMDLKMFEATEWILDEPGEDSTKFDVFMPTIVKPLMPPAQIQTPKIGPDGQQVAGYEYGILRQFTFSSKLQRMSVVVRRLGAPRFELFAKGSPEMIVSLSRKETVPENFQEFLMQYTQQGFRVIALAHKELRLNYVKIQRAQREQVECKLTFLGLVVLENQLKSQTTPTIKLLRTARIRPIMVTGDNMLTALSVAKQCQMISQRDQVIFLTVLPSVNGDQLPDLHWVYAGEKAAPDLIEMQTDRSGDVIDYTNGDVTVDLNCKKLFHFAITGKTWSMLKKHFSSLIPELIVFGTVFARFSPDQKQQLVEALQEVGYYVGMCGDGANDCGALKAAHAGISLSEAEASVASPFTSKEPNIICVPNVIREGRAALVTSFGIFKYMASYSLTQFISVCILYWVGANLTDVTFLYVDLILLTSLGITFCYTGAYSDLVPAAPKVSLIALAPILSLIGQLLTNFAFQMFTWIYTFNQPWFEPYVPPPSKFRNFTCHEVTAVFSVSAFQYISMAIAFSKGAPYRKSMFTNYLFIVNIFVGILLTLGLVLFPFEIEWLLRIFQLRPAPVMSFRLFLVVVAIANFFICLIVETYLIDLLVQSKLEKLFSKKLKTTMKQYKLIEKQTNFPPDWLPPSSSDMTLAELMTMENNTGNEQFDSKSINSYSETDSDSQSDVEIVANGDLGVLADRRRRSRKLTGDSERLIPV